MEKAPDNEIKEQINAYVNFVRFYFETRGFDFNTNAFTRPKITDLATHEEVKQPYQESYVIRNGNKKVYLEVFDDNGSPAYKYFSTDWEIEDLPFGNIDGHEGLILNPKTIRETGGVFNKENITNPEIFFENLEEVVHYLNK